MDIGEIFLSILATISESITTLLGMLPNPDPFPQIIDNLEMQADSIMPVAYYWLDQFFYARIVIDALGTWFIMFPVAWIIMMLWKWLKAR